MTFGEQNTEKEAHEMLSYSLDQGINIIDTAEMVSSYPFPLLALFPYPLKFSSAINEAIHERSI
jgi:aryl-alcohol dehydrogenase-like predicted oxidoreductase